MGNITVEIVYALPEKQVLHSLQVAPPCSVRQAIILSGILDEYPEISLTRNKIGIFSKTVSLEQELTPGDRIEIYRPLLVDPKQARRAKALLQPFKPPA